MRILRSVVLSRCRDGSVVSEYYLDQDIPESFIPTLQDRGVLTQKNLSGMILFTLEVEGLFCMKGMSGDRIICCTHAKEATIQVEAVLSEILSSRNG